MWDTSWGKSGSIRTSYIVILIAVLLLKESCPTFKKIDLNDHANDHANDHDNAHGQAHDHDLAIANAHARDHAHGHAHTYGQLFFCSYRVHLDRYALEHSQLLIYL